ncbi:solute carrier family 25 member 40 isoform X2 [Eurytemora carolleeae]|uniref:solute carrier family 25 member 40 isoform X2 n=1 Tax=Eurytemora carolleeae TaxID=1294199 RepID=UPI000C76097F|nr:solute carrier family 25 member 40 isoform X2 [Eurytemora carolleeae]|eukprot:XP_023329941.1 solute carrier family 25 member 40-like isoform X2 [Eurytemora affinis]
MAFSRDDSNVPEGSALSPRQQMLSSGAGALMVSLFMTPLDVVKIRLQAQEQVYMRKCFLYSNGIMDHICPRMNGDPPVRALHTVEEICNCKWYNRPKYFTGTTDALVKIAKVEGVGSLWSGLSPTLVLAVPTTMVYFTTYEQLKKMINKRFNTVVQGEPVWVALASGGLARIWAVTLVNPLELVRTKMQSQKMAFYQVKSCLSELIKQRGIQGLWSGYTATLLRDVPFSALYWPLYEGTKKLFEKKMLLGHDAFLINFLSGAAAGTVASTITLPFDVVKTTKQIELGETMIGGGSTGVIRTNSEIFRDILKQSGPRGLFAGLTPRILKVAPACAIMISSYEFFKKFFREKNTQHFT